MAKRRTDWVKILYGPLFTIIGFFYRSYRINRDRVARVMSTPWAASLFRVAVLLTFIAWIGVWLLASDESRHRLTQAVQDTWRAVTSESN
jgi:hypothetical protein